MPDRASGDVGARARGSVMPAGLGRGFGCGSLTLTESAVPTMPPPVVDRGDGASPYRRYPRELVRAATPFGERVA
jgi:hypothetical protein